MTEEVIKTEDGDTPAEEIKSKHPGGRPTKLTLNFLDIAKRIVDDDINAIIFTDEELLFQINEKLSEEQRITERTFQRWKAKSDKVNELDDLGKRFVVLIKSALIKQKRHLFEKFREEPNQWQRWAWIIERKFDHWNIRQKTDITTAGKPLPLLHGISSDHNTQKDTGTQEEN
jgi:hypothetical protein